jgi:hypothetical protein
MVESTEYRIKCLLLQVSKKGLVVQVRQTIYQHDQHQLTDLPDWMFHSSNAIWFADGDSSMYDRALAGEEIKKKLLAEIPLRSSKKIWSQ